MGANNRNNGSGMMDFGGDAFPLLSKDNSALDPNLLGGVPQAI